MSKTNEQKTPAPQAGAATGAGDLAVVQSTPAAPAATAAPQRDEHHGRGGLYRMVNGVRQRVGGTKAAPTQPVKAKE